MGELPESRSRPVFRAVFPARGTVLAPRGAREMFTGGGGHRNEMRPAGVAGAGTGSGGQTGEES